MPKEETNHRVLKASVVEKHEDLENGLQYSIPVQETGGRGGVSEAGVLYTKNGAKLTMNKQGETNCFLCCYKLVKSAELEGLLLLPYLGTCSLEGFSCCSFHGDLVTNMDTG